MRTINNVATLVAHNQSMSEAIEQVRPDLSETESVEFLVRYKDTITERAEQIKSDDTQPRDVIITSKMMIEDEYTCPHCNQIISEKAIFVGDDPCHSECGGKINIPSRTAPFFESRTLDKLAYFQIGNYTTIDEHKAECLASIVDKPYHEYVVEGKVVITSSALYISENKKDEADLTIDQILGLAKENSVDLLVLDGAVHILNEALPKSVGERISRTTRPDRPDPDDHEFGRDVGKSGDNDPTRTSRGRRAVDKQGDSNKTNADKFEKFGRMAVESTAILQSDNPELLFGSLTDPIATYCNLKTMVEDEEYGDKAKQIVESMRSKLFNKDSGPYKVQVSGYTWTSDSSDSSLLHEARKLRETMKSEFQYDFSWIVERKQGTLLSYYVYADKIPSELYAEHRTGESSSQLRVVLD